MVKSFILVLGLLWGCAGAQAKNLPNFATPFQILNQIEVAQDAGGYPIAPSEAANIARDANPGSKVLGVKLLPSGVYAVTLKSGGSVSRVMVDATSGAIS